MIILFSRKGARVNFNIPSRIFKQKVYYKHNIAINIKKETETECWVENIHIFEYVLTLRGDGSITTLMFLCVLIP